MKILRNFIIIVILSIGHVSLERVSFEGHKMLKLIPTTQKHLELIDQLQHNPDFDLLNRIALESPVFVVLSPLSLIKYSALFNENKIEYKIIDSNIQRKLDLQEKSMNRTRRDVRSIVGKFARYSEINSYIDEVVLEESEIAASYVAGATSENRIVKAIVFRTSTSNRGIFIDCGFHAREWIAVSSCIWLIDQIYKAYDNNDADMRAILAKYEIHIIPLVNPDGYEYSHTTNRMWRKNRKVNAGSSCVGVDLNRNFGFQWMTAGASSNPCSETYAGPSADSELETKDIQRSILSRKGFWDAYLTIHTYGQYWLTSWSYTTDYPADYDDIKLAADKGAAALKSLYGTDYTTGHSGVLFGRLAGVSDDWAKGVAEVKYAATLELSPGDGTSDASFGFALPEDRVPKVGQELYAGVVGYIKHVGNL
ncbi:unnamed protein product [Brachionus calyciflorus]|uniref:Peptidase M14 domain-containing protein n=1 Tax=Brachionus calyciflorus TaxID=104777 RepID=A0A814EQE1_9BILA|nr:unnamed protein product [Brachionus calyciflorus]